MECIWVKSITYILLVFSFTFPQKSQAQEKSTDTLFLLKKLDHSIFIEYSKKSKFYKYISDFKFAKADSESYNNSLNFLKSKHVKLTKRKITDLPKKWIALKYFNKNFYTYYPSDFYSHFKVSITDTAFIDFGGEGPTANKIIDYKKINGQTFSFSLTGLERPKRKLTIHIIDKLKGIAIFEELPEKNRSQYLLMIDVTKIRQLPIVVNYCKTQKQEEFEFDEFEYKKILKVK